LNALWQFQNIIFHWWRKQAKQNVPLEIKYLAVVESALNWKQFPEWALLDYGSSCTKPENNMS
jgi:hypothetical protein